MKKSIIWVVMSMLILTSCLPSIPVAAVEAEPVSPSNPSAAGNTRNSSPIQNPYSLESLASRSYGEGELNVEYAWENQAEFTRYYITYDSDGLTIHGFVNVPTGRGPFPVVIALHGYIPASEYQTRDYSTRYADAMARNGYIVLHPNLRNFPPSDSVPRVRDYHTGYVIDVLNLLAHVKEFAGQEGIFEDADVSHLGVWGHSLGGGVALRLVSLVPEIKAAVLYAAVSQRYSNSSAGFSMFDLPSTSAAFSLHHGTDDDTIDVGWTEQLCSQLIELGKEVECFYYEDQPHTFPAQGNSDALLIQRTRDFLKIHLMDDEGR